MADLLVNRNRETGAYREMKIFTWQVPSTFKNIKYFQMKKFCSLGLLALSFLFFQACNNSGKSSKQHADSLSEASKILTKEDTQFMAQAATINMLEIKLGNLAQQKAGSPRIKAFAQMLTNDHTMLNGQLKMLASNIHVALPDSLDEAHQNDVQNLSKEKKSNFDKDYVDMMVKGHEGAVKAFQDAVKSIQDSAIHAYITGALPILQKHLDSAQAIQQGMK